MPSTNPTYEEFSQLVERVNKIEEENEFLRSLVLGQQWLTKTQTLKVLGISDVTLWRLTKEDKIVNCKEGSKYMYDIDSVRNYLAAKKISKKAADDRIIVACYTPFVSKSKI